MEAIATTSGSIAHASTKNGQAARHMGCATTCYSGAGGEDWPRHQWALQVWARWPHLAELELQPGDLLPPAQRALDRDIAAFICPVGQVALRLFVLCSMGGFSKLGVLEDNADALAADVGLVLSYSLLDVVESGWPIFSLLSLLHHAIRTELHGWRRLHGHSLAATVWMAQISSLWATAPAVGPPAPGSIKPVPPGRKRGQEPAGREPTVARLCCPRPLAVRDRSLLAAAMAAAKAAGASTRPWRRAYLCAVGRWLRVHSKSHNVALGLLRSHWPISEALGLLENSIHESQQVHAPDEVGTFAAATLVGGFKSALQTHLARQLPLVAGSLSSLPVVSSAILPSEAFFFHGLVDMVGASAIVESGIGNGGSTRAACAWARALPGRRVFAVERAPLAPALLQALRAACGGLLELYAGDAFSVLDAVLLRAANSNNSRVALLLDGPKGRVAVRLALQALRRFSRLVVVAVHDVFRRDARYRDRQGRHLTRVAMEAAPYLSVFSDESWFLHLACHLDANYVIAANESATGSYGPTLGALVQTGAIRIAQ